ncbi:MAG TPA: winged helix-turn-helix domain-containing protein [Terracidiphilus sp.]|nr:winged helix-turn-helix domain-containing protein [Terracidiphilus sp.]HEV2323592.1 winged helix-turn-helix domain-containing protein [Terracidiphilus sp.]
MLTETAHTFRFASIEVHERELRATRNGEPVSIEPKAFRVLIYLLQRAGHLVTKKELLDAVWGDTAVTDNSLTRAIALLRRTLEDDPYQPRFIETVATAGYRFICPVDASAGPAAAEEVPAGAGFGQTAKLDGQPPVSESASPASPANRASIRRPRVILGASVALLVLLVGGIVWYFRHPLPLLRISSYGRLTLDGRRKDAIGTDGNNVFLNLEAPAGIGQVPVVGGKIAFIVPDLPGGFRFRGYGPWVSAVSPDGSSLLVNDNSIGPGSEYGVWVVGTSGRPARFLTKEAWDATWSPDGRQVLYATAQGDLYVIPSEGGPSRLLLASHNGPLGWPGDLAWSPDGSKIRFTRDFTIWEISSDGSNLHQVIPGWRASHVSCSGRWTPDGDFYLFLSANAALYGPFSLTAQIWALDERRGLLGLRSSKPFQLSTGPIRWGAPVPSRDGKLVFARGSDLRGELVRFDKETKHFMPYLAGISAEFVEFSHDGGYVAYVSFPDGVLWRANRDGTGVVQLTSPPMYPENPRWSPDDTQILFSNDHDHAIYTVLSQGGAVQRVFPDENEWERDPNWSPDGKKIVFAAFPGYTGGAVNQAEIRILDLEKHTTVTLPDRPGHVHSPRWSPDGPYILATNLEATELLLFDLQTQHWSRVLQGRHFSWPCFSRDGRFIYVEGSSSGVAGILRVPLTGGKVELVAAEPDFHSTGLTSSWWGLDPDGTPLALRDEGTDEIYALTLKYK